MYCTFCGHQNAETNKFCESCGKPLLPGAVPTGAPALVAKTSSARGYRVALPGAAVAVLGFFLPWILVSCGGQPIKSFTGWELASGSKVSIGFGEAQVIPGRPVLFLILLAGLAVFVLAYFAWQRRGVLKGVDGYGVIGLGALPLLILLAQLSGQSELREQAITLGEQSIAITIEYQPGLWGVVLGNIAVFIGGVLNLKQET